MHFTVLVKGDDVHKLLAPYQENNMGTCPDEFMEFTPLNLSDYGYSTHAEAIADNHLEKDGKAGYYCNPDSQWDWYEIGGRWNGYLLLKNGLNANQATKKDIDFEKKMEKTAENASLLYDQVMEVFGELEPHKPYSSFSSLKDTNERNKYFDQPRLQALKTAREAGDSLRWIQADDFLVCKEDYIQQRKQNSIITYAVLDEEEGWQLIDGNFKSFNEFLNRCNDDDILTVVDCHV